MALQKQYISGKGKFTSKTVVSKTRIGEGGRIQTTGEGRYGGFTISSANFTVSTPTSEEAGKPFSFLEANFIRTGLEDGFFLASFVLFQEFK